MNGDPDSTWLTGTLKKFSINPDTSQYPKSPTINPDDEWLRNTLAKFNVPKPGEPGQIEGEPEIPTTEQVDTWIEEANKKTEELTKENNDWSQKYLQSLSKEQRKASYSDITGLSNIQAASDFSGGKVNENLKQINQYHQAVEILKKSKELIQAPEKGQDIGFIKSFWKGLRSPIIEDFATLGLTELERNFNILSIVKKAEKDPASLTESEKNLMDSYRVFQLIQSGKDPKSAYNIGRISSEMIPYMIQFATTGGIVTGIEEGITGVAREAAVKGLKAYLKKAAGYTAGAAIQTVAMPIGYTDFAERRVSQYVIGDQGDVTLKGNAEPAGISALKSYGMAFSEVWSEGTGEWMQMGVKSIGGKLMKEIPKRGGIYGFINSVKKTTRWNGAIYEWGEEQINNVLNSVFTGDQPLSNILDGKQQWEIFASCLVMGTAFKATELPAEAQVYTARKNFEKSEQKFTKVVPSNIALQVLDAMQDKSLKDMGVILSGIPADELSKEQQGAVLGYVINRFRYDALQGGIESDLDEKAKVFREKETGDIITAEDQAGNKYFINERLEDGTVIATNAETFKKSILAQSKLTNSSSVGYLDWRNAQTETTLEEMFQNGSASMDQIVAEEALKRTPYQIGENILYNSNEYTVTDITTDGTLFIVPVGEEVTEPVEITPEMYKSIQKTEQVPTESAKTEQAPRTVKVGEAQYQMNDNKDGTFTLNQQFTDKTAVNEVVTQLNDKFEGRGYDIKAEATPIDPNDPFSDSVYTIRIDTKQKPQGEIKGAKITPEVAKEGKVEETKEGTTEETKERVPEVKKPKTARKKLIELNTPEDIYNEYVEEKRNAPIQKLTIPQQRLLDRRVNRRSFERFGDRNLISKTIAKRWFTRENKDNLHEIDAIAKEISEETGIEFTPQDIIETILQYPSRYARRTTDRQRQLRRKYKELTGKSIDQHKLELRDNLGQEIINFVNQYDKNWFTYDDIKRIIRKNKKQLSDEKYKQYTQWIEDEYRRIEEANTLLEPEPPELPTGEAEIGARNRKDKGETEAKRTERVGEPKRDVEKEQEYLARKLGKVGDKVWVEQEVAKITKGWNIPKITVVEKESDLPAGIQTTIKQSRTKSYEIGITTATHKIKEIGELLDKASAFWKEGKYKEANKIYDEILARGEKEIRELFDDIKDISIDFKRTKGTFFEETEPTFDFVVHDSGNNFNTIIRRLSKLGEGWKQDNVHISQTQTRLGKGEEIGKELPDGSVLEMNYNIRFENKLTDAQYAEILKKIHEIGLAGATLKEDGKVLTLYNISKLDPNNEKFEKKIKLLSDYISKSKVKGQIEEGIRKLWNVGDTDGGATRTYERVRSDFLEGEKEVGTVGIFISDEKGIFIIAENVIKKSRQASRALLTDTLVHEAIGHYGIRSVLGKSVDQNKYKKIIINLARERFDQIGKMGLIKAYNKSEDITELSDDDLFELGEEYLAHLSENNPEDNALKRIISWIREQLRRLFPDVKWTDNDIRSLLAKTRKFVTEQKPTEQKIEKPPRKKVETKVPAFAGEVIGKKEVSQPSKKEIVVPEAPSEAVRAKTPTFAGETLGKKEIPRFKKYIYPKQPSELSEREKNEIFEKAKDEFGITNNIKDALYVLPDGKMLDKRLTKDRPFGIEHWEVEKVLREYFKTEPNDYEKYRSADYFIELGIIRVNQTASRVGLEFYNKPTEQQFKIIKSLIESRNGNVVVDLGTIIDDSRPFVEYPQGTSYQRIINDIRNYFDNGIRPVVPEYARFKKVEYPKGIKKPTELTEDEKSQIFELVKKDFTVTDNINQTAYILPDGSMLKGGVGTLLEQWERKDQRWYWKEHRDVGVILNNHFKTHAFQEYFKDSGIDPIRYFIEMGTIRKLSSYIEFFKNPTISQMRVIKKLALVQHGSVGIDYGTSIDSNRPYVAYPKGSNYLKITNDIKRYYNEGISPLVPEYMRFKRDPKISRMKELLAEAKGDITPERRLEIEQTLMDLYFNPGDLVSYEEKARLSREQQARFKIAPAVESKTFKDWFKNSKVVDEEGKPLVVYHGTLQEFDEFNRTGSRMTLDALVGFHFAKDPKITNAFTMGSYVQAETLSMFDPNWADQIFTPDTHTRVRPGGNVLPVYIKIENLLDLRGREGFDQTVIGRAIAIDVFKRNKELLDKWMKYDNPLHKEQYSDKQWRDYIDDLYRNNVEKIINDRFYSPFDIPLVQEVIDDFIQNTKYDGIVYENTAPMETRGVEDTTCYIVFKPENIKSATGNVGTYSPETADIRYKKHIETAYGSIEKYKENINKAVNEAKKIRLKVNKRYVEVEELAGEFIEKRTLLDIFKENALKEPSFAENIEFDKPVGMKVESAQDVAQIYSLFRSPYIEKGHVVFIKDGKIIASFTETLGHPFSTTMTRSMNFPKTLTYYAQTQGVDQVYVIHNHPSGNISTSEADVFITGKLIEQINIVNSWLPEGTPPIEFKGHILLDSDKFGLITKHGLFPKYDSMDYKKPEDVPDFFDSRIKVSNNVEMTMVAKQLLTEIKYRGAVVFLARNLALNGFMPIPDNLDFKQLEEMIRTGLISRGASQFIIVHDGMIDKFLNEKWAKEFIDLIDVRESAGSTERFNVYESHSLLPKESAREKEDVYILDKNTIRYKRVLNTDTRLKKLASGELNMSTLDKIQEALQDRMLTVKMWQDEIIRRGGKTSNMSDPWGQENLTHSIVMNTIKEFDKKLLDPVKDSVSKIILSSENNLDTIQKYLKAKHAIERNAALREKTGKDNNSGFTTEEAEVIVQVFEKEIDPDLVQELWINIRKATDFILDRWKNDGFIDQVGYDRIKSKYKNYVPLRGWMDVDESQEIYGYQQGTLRKEIQLNKKAEGRTSESEDPLQYIANMAYSAIIAGEKNRVKQHAARLAMQNVDMKDLHQFRRLYLVFTGGFDENGKEIWEERYERPDQELWDQGMVQLKIQNTDNQTRRPRAVAKQHEVEVWFNGEKQVLVFPDSNGIAPAIANALNKHNDIFAELTGFMQNSVGKVTRILTANFTSKNPAFFIVNQMRDISYATLAHFVHGDTKTAAKFMANLPKSRAAITRALNNKANPSKDKMDSLYRDFILNGGETGYIHLRDIDQITSDMRKDIKKLVKQKNFADKAWETVWIKGGKILENFAIRSENLSRFTTYVTAIEQGKTPREAAKAAKDITVNFNRKGRLSGLLGSTYAFFNASLQGGENIIRMARQHPVKFSMLNLGFMSLGFSVAYMASLWSGDDDKDGKDDFDQLSDYLKYNYLTIPVGHGKFISLPLPFGFRFFYSLGVLTYQNQISDEKRLGEAVKQGMLNLFESISPVNPVDLLTKENELSFRPIVPTAFIPAYDLTINEDFAGNRIYKQPFTQVQKGRLADSALGMQYANKIIKWITDEVFKLGGGDPTTKSNVRFDKEGSVMFDEKGEVKKVPELFDWNPSKVEYVIEYFLGGRGKFWNDVLKTGQGIASGAYEAATGDREFKKILDDVRMQDVPIIHRLLRQTWGSSVYDDYYRIFDIMEDYKQGKRNREVVYGEVGSLQESVNEQKYELFQDFEKDIQEISDDMKEIDDPETLEYLKQNKEDIMKRFLEEYEKFNVKKQNNENRQ